MLDTIDLGKQTINIKTKFLFGIGLILFVVFVAIIAVCVEHKSEIALELEKCEMTVKEMISNMKKENFGPTQFDDRLPKKDSQPLVYQRNVKIAPGNCKPYSGCFFPSKASNPINLMTGERNTQPVVDGKNVWCEESWRDCSAYQTCKKGKCVPKDYSYGI